MGVLINFLVSDLVFLSHKGSLWILHIFSPSASWLEKNRQNVSIVVKMNVKAIFILFFECYTFGA